MANLKHFLPFLQNLSNESGQRRGDGGEEDRAGRVYYFLHICAAIYIHIHLEKVVDWRNQQNPYKTHLKGGFSLDWFKYMSDVLEGEWFGHLRPKQYCCEILNMMVVYLLKEEEARRLAFSNEDEGRGMGGAGRRGPGGRGGPRSSLRYDGRGRDGGRGGGGEGGGVVGEGERMTTRDAFYQLMAALYTQIPERGEQFWVEREFNFLFNAVDDVPTVQHLGFIGALG